MAGAITKYIDVVFDRDYKQVAPSVYRYDHGIALRIRGVPTNVVWQCHFSCRGNDHSIPSIATIEGNAVVGVIPDIILMQPREVICYLYYEDNYFGRTVYEIFIPVQGRARPASSSYTPQQIDTYDQLVAMLHSLIDEVEAMNPVTQPTIAPDYDDLTSNDFPLHAGFYCWHDDILYRAISDIPSAESWTASHWETAVIGNDLAALKENTREFAQKIGVLDALDEKIQYIEPVNWLDLSAVVSGERVFADGTTAAVENISHTDFIPVAPGDLIRFYKTASPAAAVYKGNVCVYDANKNVMSGGTNSSSSASFTVPFGAAYVIVSAASTAFSASAKPMIVKDGTQPSAYSAYFAPYFSLTEDFLTDETAARIVALEADVGGMAAADDEDVGKMLTVAGVENGKVTQWTLQTPASGGDPAITEFIEERTVSVEPVNWLDLSAVVNDERIKADGTSVESSGVSHSGFIPVAEGDEICCFKMAPPVSAIYKTNVCLYDMNKNVVPGGTDSASSSAFVIPSGVAYAIVSAASTAFQSTSKPMIVKDGVQPSDYSAYFAKSISFTEDFITEDTKIKIDSMSETLMESLIADGFANGWLREDGTIYGYGATAGVNNIHKYPIPDGTEKIYISGTVKTDISDPKFCALWFVASGAMMENENVPQTIKPQTWDLFEVSIPNGAEEIWADKSIKIFPSRTAAPDIAKRLAIVESGTVDVQGIKDSLMPRLSARLFENGWLRENGTITGSGATTAGDRVCKYQIPSGQTKIYLSGRVNYDVLENRYCVLWFVQNGAMMTNQFVPVTQKPQSWNMSELTIPNGAEEIWADKSIQVYSDDSYLTDAASRILALEANSSNADFFAGPFTWTKRVFGLRMLADAQGCYFIPFNALGIGVNRGNGLHGDDYIADQIHPTALGGYNVACGVWSYLKNIPVWHTSVPASGTPEPMDGTQWNGKKWYAYGTSLSTQSLGKYADQVAAWGGLILTNKAIGGGALVTNRNIYNRLLDLEDGKLEADLITIEVGANDSGPLGDPWSLDTSTFFGALNHCIKAMYIGGVQAQIVIMASYGSRYSNSDPEIKYDVNRLYNA